MGELSLGDGLRGWAAGALPWGMNAYLAHGIVAHTKIVAPLTSLPTTLSTKSRGHPISHPSLESCESQEG